MSVLESVRGRLGEFSECFDVGPYVAIPTQCLYPSNKAVTVYVTGGLNECVVSDNGGAIDEISISGLNVPNADVMLRQVCHGKGVKVSRGQIMSPAVPLEGLAPAVVAVANASRAAAEWGLKHLKAHRRRDIVSEISSILAHSFEPSRILAKEGITGASNRRYHVDYVVRLDKDRRLLIDGVLPEASSINAKAITHLDIQRMADERFLSYIAYDEQDDWKASDLSLLQMASNLVPLSAMPKRMASFSVAVAETR